MRPAPRALSPASLALLTEILGRRAPHLLAVIDGRRSLDFPLDVLKEIETAIDTEFTTNGLKADGEPNQRGIELEQLLDEVMRWVWQKQEGP